MEAENSGESSAKPPVKTEGNACCKGLNVWMIVSIILAIALVGTIVFLKMPQANPTGAVTAAGTAGIDKQALAEKARNYLKTNFFEKQGISVTLKKIENVNEGLLLANFELDKSGQKQVLDCYITADGKQLIIPQGVLELDKPVNLAAQEPETPIQKNDKPSLQLFVMSFCPFGKQAEQGLYPALKLLGNTADFTLNFIVSKQGSDYASLHGSAELEENVRQLCVQKYSKEKLWDYVNAINENCTLQNVKDCWKTAAQKAGVDVSKIESCTSSEKNALLDAEIAASEKYSVSGSPTLIINEGLYNGGRSSEEYKQGICNAFNTAPADCNKTLDSNGAEASGGCET